MRLATPLLLSLALTTTSAAQQQPAGTPDTPLPAGLVRRVYDISEWQTRPAQRAGPRLELENAIKKQMMDESFLLEDIKGNSEDEESQFIALFEIFLASSSRETNPAPGIRFTDKRLIVDQTPEIHAQIERLRTVNAVQDAGLRTDLDGLKGRLDETKKALEELKEGVGKLKEQADRSKAQ